MLQHPAWADSSIWEPVLELLGEPAGRYRCIRFDTRGFGRSPAPAAPFTQLADLIDVLGQLAVRRAALLAHSGGAGAAIDLALAQPQRVSALLLAGLVREYVPGSAS